jgi:transposase
VLVSAANRHDGLFVEPILDSMPAIKRGGRGHPRRRPVKLHGDKGYDNPRVRRYLRRRGITARIARIGRDSSARLGRHRWVVERTLGWLLSYKRLALRYDRTATTITALARLAVTLIRARRFFTRGLASACAPPYRVLDGSKGVCTASPGARTSGWSWTPAGTSTARSS